MRHIHDESVPTYPRNQLGNQSPQIIVSFQDWLFWRDFFGVFSVTEYAYRSAWRDGNHETIQARKNDDSYWGKRLILIILQDWNKDMKPAKRYSLFLSQSSSSVGNWELWWHCFYYWSSWHTTCVSKRSRMSLPLSDELQRLNQKTSDTQTLAKTALFTVAHTYCLQ